MKKHLVVLTGAGMSAESGIATFRGAGGLWEGYPVEKVASPEGWQENKELVLDFYNQRRRQIGTVEPNDGHRGLKDLEENFNVTIITQNVDDLHERAGSKNIFHLHGEITKVRSTLDPELVYDVGYQDVLLGDKCDKGSQLRPHIVWFGEMVPMLETAIKLTATADILVIIGTSMAVYPAASLYTYAPRFTPMYIIDPNVPEVHIPNLIKIQKGASEGVKELKKLLKD